VAHKLIAADLGAASIKLARYETTFRKVTFIDARVVPCRTEGKVEERIPQQLAILAQTMKDRYAAEEVTLGLPGEMLRFRVVDLPFENPRQIESVLPYELESLVLTPVEELLVDFVIVRSSAEETRVLAVTAPRELVQAVTKAAADLQLPLRSVGASPLAYAAFFEPPPAEATETTEESAPPPGPALVIDVGCDGTTVCALRGNKPEMARTIGRGGRQLRDAIAGAFRLTEDDAERAVRDSGFVGHEGLRPTTPAQGHMESAVREALRPLVRELRQTLAAYHATYGERIERLWLTGGGSRLVGLAEHLAEELGLPAAPLAWPEREGFATGPSVENSEAELAVAVGLALGTAGQSAQVNFRRGEFAYRSDFSFLRAKALHLTVGLTLVLCFAAFNAYASLRGLQKEHDLLAARFKKATLEVFGQEKTDPTGILEDLKAGPKGLGQLPIPTSTAFDLLDDISRVVPPPGKIKLDILELDIKPKKTFIKATAETAQQMDDLADALSKIECFEDVQKGKLSTVTVQPPPPPPPSSDMPPDARRDDNNGKPMELKQFTLTIKATCP